jgi:chorismate mutase
VHEVGFLLHIKMNFQKTIKNQKRPFLISGPCSAETEEQVMSICVDLKNNTDVSLLRAGIWKPRTRPDSFEGIGEIGLKWLVDAGKETNLKTTTEVANAKHVELALKAGVDVLWIGARTSVNPFTVQEIVDALKGTQTPVMIKNPVNPDLSLWLGAFERFFKADLTDLVAIHRGFSVYKHPKYRNVPSWEIPIAFKQNLTDIPMICDPSHITGKRNLLLEISQKAMDLNFDGLIIESHPNPDKAWSDAEQQITAFELNDLMGKLILRDKIIEDSLSSELNDYRQKISLLDDQIFELLSNRMKLSEEVGIFKRKNNVTILQEEHWRKIIESRLASANDLFLTEIFVKNFMDSMHQESIRHQIKVMNPDLKNLK